MKSESHKEILVPLSGCEKHIWGGFDNAHVVVVLETMGIMVRRVTSYGRYYYRIHDNYTHLDLARMGYVQGIDNGRLVDIPELYLTQKGVAVVTEAFELLFAAADKDMIKAVIERSCCSKKEVVLPCASPEGHEDNPGSSCSSGKERTKEHVCLHGKCGGCRQEK